MRQAVIDNANRFHALKIEGELIFRRVKFRDQSDGPISEAGLWRLWIPTELVPSLVSQAHDPPLAAHGGMLKTIDRLRRFYYWPHGHHVLRPTMGEPFRTERPFQQLYVDMLGPYPRSKDGNTYILIVWTSILNSCSSNRFVVQHPSPLYVISRRKFFICSACLKPFCPITENNLLANWWPIFAKLMEWNNFSRQFIRPKQTRRKGSIGQSWLLLGHTSRPIIDFGTKSWQKLPVPCVIQYMSRLDIRYTI